jgi:hypothetical protein
MGEEPHYEEYVCCQAFTGGNHYLFPRVILDDVIAISAGPYHSLFVKSDGKAYVLSMHNDHTLYVPRLSLGGLGAAATASAAPGGVELDYGSGRVFLRVVSQNGHQYGTADAGGFRIEWSNDFSLWSPRAEQGSAVNGKIEFDILVEGGVSQRFYRVRGN